jgi:hypothetical protein
MAQDGNGRTEAQQRRWDAIYGAVVSQMTFAKMAQGLMAGNSGDVTREQMADVVVHARQIADFAIDVDP